MPVWSIPGLTANDRNAVDKNQIELQGNDYRGSSVDSLSIPLVGSDSTAYVRTPMSQIPTAVEYSKGVYSNYTDVLGEYTKDNSSAYDHYNSEKNIKDIAYKISPYFRKYQNTDYLTFTTEDWIRLDNEYKARRDVYGEQNANSWIQGQIQDNVANNQGVLEKYWNGYKGMGASAYGAIVGLIGNIYGAGKYIIGSGYDVEGLNGWQNFWNNVMDNEITRYGNDASRYGSWSPKVIEQAKVLYGGISNIPILNTKAQEESIWDINTVPEAVSQGGFTVASMLIGAGEAKLAEWAFRGAKGAVYAAKAGGTLSNLSKAKTALKAVNTIEKGTYALFIPALAGTNEGLIEGLNTKLNNLEQGKAMLDAQEEQYRASRVKQLLAENPSMSVDDADKLAGLEFAKKYAETLNYIEAISSKAGINNFYANSAINGFLNATFKAGLQAPKVQSALQSSKLTSWAFPSGNFKATGTVGNAKVTSKFGVAKQAFNIIKEPFGEFTEEYLQSVSDAAMSGSAEYSISRYIENKYNGESVADMGEYMAGSFSAGWAALTNSLTDKKTIEAGIYGALSSVIGTHGPVRRTTKVDSDGNIVYKRNADGSIARTTSGKPIVEKTLFGKGLNAEGKIESRWEAIQRATPWRSGLYSNIKATRNEARRLKTEAGIIEDWLNDPKNVEKFDGSVGTLSWAKQMEKSAATGDEFEYRNSVLGKTINDAIMLEKLKGTSFYETFMNNLTTAANAEKGSKAAAEMVASIRENVNTSKDFEGMTDDQVFETIKKNANIMLDTMNTIQNESDNIEKVLGYVDEDTKVSLIYGKMAIDDWTERSSQLNTEINNITRGIENTVESSTLTEEQKSSVANFGSLKRAQKVLETLRETMKSLEQDIQNLEKRKGTVASEKRTLKAKKAKYKTLEKKTKEIAKSLEDMEAVENTVLNESEIMALPADARAVMLNPENLSLFSDAQQEVIKNVINKGTATNIDFSSKIQDVGRMNIATKAYLRQYNSILSDPEAFNNFIAKQREAAGDVLSNKKYESLSEIKDYTQFAEELDNIYDNSTAREKRLIEHHLRRDNNLNFARYEKQRESIRDLIEQIAQDDYFESMDENDIDMFMHALAYLANKGIDITNVDEARRLLLEKDADGNFLFEKYVESVNSKLKEEDKAVFTSMGEVIQTYVDAVNRNKKDIKDKENAEEPVVVDDTPVSNSVPAEPIEVHTNVTEDVIEEAQPEEQPETSPQGEEIPAENNTIQVALNIVKNINRFGYAAKAIAERIINNAALDSNPTTLAEYLNAEANKLTINSAEHVNFEAADLLRQVATRISNLSEKELQKDVEKSGPDNIFDSKMKSRANAMESLDMDYITKKYPNSALTRYYNRYKIKEFLESDKLDNSTPIFFFSDPQLVEECREEMEKSGKKLGLNSLPIVAVVEVESGGITIGGKQYQPIAIMPATDNQTYSGATRMSEIRKNAYRQGDENEASLIKDEQGNVITANMHGKVVAKAPEHLAITEPNRTVQTLLINDSTAQERQELENLSKTERRKSETYKRLKSNFLSRLKVVNNQIVYELPNLKGVVIPITAFITPVHRTTDRNSDKTIAELFNDNDVSVLKSNSRLERAANTLVKFFKETFNTEEFTYEQLEDGTIVPTQETQTALDNYANQLGNKLNNFLNLPARQGWKYHLSTTDRTLADGRKMYELSIVDNEGNTIVLGDVTNGEMTENTQMNILKHLIMEDNGEVRMRDSKNSFVVWNVSHTDIRSQETIAKDNVSRIFDDDIIEFSKTSLQYTIKGVVINAPFTLTGDANYFTPGRKTTTTQATPQTQEATPASDIQGDSRSVAQPVVDTDTGVVVEGDPQNVDNNNQQEAKPVGTIRDRRKKKGNKVVEATARVIPAKFSWGRFEGAKMSVEEINEVLQSLGITNEEQWNNRTDEEMERVLKCMGAL